MDWNGKTNEINAAIKAIKESHEPRIQALQAKGRQLQDDAPRPEAVEAMINVDFDITWKNVSLIFDFPSITMKEQKISFDLPEIAMKLQTFSWDRPDICMKYVEFPWGGGFHVPEPCMKREEIKLHIPEITMRTQEIIMHLPEFRTETVQWVLGLPQITVKNVKVETEKIKQRATEIQAEGDAIAAEMRQEVDKVLAQLYGDVGQVKEKFDAALMKVNSSIDDALSHGLDPIKLPGESGDVNLRKMYSALLEQRNAAIEKLTPGQALNGDGRELVRLQDPA